MDRVNTRSVIVTVLVCSGAAGTHFVLCSPFTPQDVGGNQKRVRSTVGVNEVPLQCSWIYSLCDVGNPVKPQRPPNCADILQGNPITGSW